MTKVQQGSRKLIQLGALVLAIGIGAGIAMTMTSASAAPDVTFVNLQGTKVPLASLRGKVVLVNFWATSCATCVKEMPQMVDTYQRYHARGLDFVAVAMSDDPPNYVINYTETRHLPFTVALDPQSTLAKAFGDVRMTPTTFLIDKDGKIIKRYVGEPDFPALRQLLETALAA
ncbi:MAG: TlpA family protein disulfide reductase [Pseudomonadota bacterium]|nr:TlpA family protein disulfide reductase [Pseudomonadota bacterium]